MSDDDLIRRVDAEKAMLPFVHNVIADDAIAAIRAVTPPDDMAKLTKERDEATAGMFEWVKKAEKDAAALAASEARVAKLVEKFTALEKAASEVSRRGAETGQQWTKLTIALLAARAAIRGEQA